MSYQYLHESVLDIIEHSDDSRIAWLGRPKWIGYPRAQEILNKLEDLLVYPKQKRMPGMLLVGDTNNGKSRLIEQFTKKHLVDVNPGGEHIIAPVLFVEAPPSPNEAGFYTEILNILFEKVPAASIDAKRTRVITVLREIQLKVLIIDELHNLLAGASLRQQQFLNMIKYLSNKLDISIVGCGTGDLLRAVSVDPQVENRFVPEVLPKWKNDKDYRRLLMSFESLLPLRQPSKLHENDLASKIIAMSEGSIGEISLLLNSSATYAIKNQSEVIDKNVLKKCGYIPPSDRKQIAAKA